MSNKVDIIQLRKGDGTKFYPQTHADAVVGLEDVVTDVGWGTEMTTEVDLRVGSTTKRLLKTAAVTNSDKKVDNIGNQELSDVLDIFFPL